MKKNPPVIKREVKEMGGKIEELIPERGYFYIHLKGKRILVTRKFKIATDVLVGGDTTKFKDLTYLLLKEKGLPTPKSVCLYKYAEKELNKKLITLKYPLIIKDAQGSNSKGIFPNIQDIETAEKIIRREIKNFPRLIVQEMVQGKEYRILMLAGKMIAGLEMIPPRVFGDGLHTVKQLMEKKQEKTEKRTIINDLFKQNLKQQGFTLKSVPDKGQIVYLKKSSALAEGGETQDVTTLVSKKAIAVCAQASLAAGKCLAGLDVICQDISLDPEKQSFNILEINGKPDIYIHYNPTHGQTRDVVREIINFILKLKT